MKDWNPKKTMKHAAGLVLTLWMWIATICYYMMEKYNSFNPEETNLP